MSTGSPSPLKRALKAIDDLQARVDELERGDREPVALVGIGCRLPGGVEDVADKILGALGCKCLIKAQQ